MATWCRRHFFPPFPPDCTRAVEEPCVCDHLPPLPPIEPGEDHLVYARRFFRRVSARCAKHRMQRTGVSGVMLLYASVSGVTLFPKTGQTVTVGLYRRLNRTTPKANHAQISRARVCLLARKARCECPGRRCKKRMPRLDHRAARVPQARRDERNPRRRAYSPLEEHVTSSVLAHICAERFVILNHWHVCDPHDGSLRRSL